MRQLENKGNSPIIFIGMHRSGTTLVSKLMESLGVFAGFQKDVNNEALFYVGLNEWLLRSSGGSWDHPEPINYLLKNDGVRGLTLDYLRFSQSTPRAASYLGIKNYLKYRSIDGLDFAWGWKDPRSTFTLPLWLDVFPNAKVVHVVRHGVDVAQSLQKSWAPREEQLNHARKLFYQRKSLYKVRKLNSGFVPYLRPSTLEDCFKIWKSYVAQGEIHTKSLGDRAITIQFERLLENPRRELSRLCDFCNVPSSAKAIATASLKTNQSRAFAFRTNTNLVQFAEAVQSSLSNHGYSTANLSFNVSDPNRCQLPPLLHATPMQFSTAIK